MDLVTILLFIVGLVLGFFAGRITAENSNVSSNKSPTSTQRDNNNTDIK